MVHALYIDPRGPYPALLGAERCWDEKRDARLYAGPEPVVAHPPCGPWGSLKHCYRGTEHDCAVRAVDQVRRFGGVLEHPARSALWAHVGLPEPGDFTDRWGGTSFEVSQNDWGHVARKRTWLYIVGVGVALARVSADIQARTGTGVVTHWCSGRRTPFLGITKGAKPGLAPPHIKFCSSQQRRRTPPLFAAWLISLATLAQQGASLE